MSEATNASSAELNIIYKITVDGAKVFFKVLGMGTSLSFATIKMIGSLIKAKTYDKIKEDKVLNSLETKDGAYFVKMDQSVFTKADPITVGDRLDNLGINYKTISDGESFYLVVPGKDAGVLNEVLSEHCVAVKEAVQVAETAEPERSREQAKEDVIHEDKKDGAERADNVDPAIGNMLDAREVRRKNLSPNSSEVSEPTPEKKLGSQSKLNISKEKLEVLYNEGKKESEKHNASIDSKLPSPTLGMKEASI